jgi:hypothetical protein
VKIADNVLNLVKGYPEAVRSNMALVYTYWCIYDNVTAISDVLTATPGESITRAFRKLVSDGRIVLPEDIKKSRMGLERRYRDAFKKKKKKE